MKNKTKQKSKRSVIFFYNYCSFREKEKNRHKLIKLPNKKHTYKKPRDFTKKYNAL